MLFPKKIKRSPAEVGIVALGGNWEEKSISQQWRLEGPSCSLLALELFSTTISIDSSPETPMVSNPLNETHD